MASFDIDVLDATDHKKGSGPIATASSFRRVRRLTKAGEFSFPMPASDPIAAELQSKRIVRCHSLRGIPGSRTRVEFGSGIVDRVGIGVEIQGGSALTVSGNDLLDELTRRSVGDLSTVVITVAAASWVVWNNAPLGANTFTDLTFPTTVTLTSDDYLYVGFATPFDSVRFDVGATPNAVSATWTAQYWNGSTWAGVAVATDGSAVSGKLLAQDGDIAFARPPLWATTSVHGHTAYWLRLQPSATLTPAVTLQAVSSVRREASFTSIQAIMAFAPTGWSLDTVLGYNTTLTGVYLQFAGENVLEALIKVAEAIGEQFRLGNRTVIWMRKDQPSSGLLAVADGDSGVIDTNPDVVLITRLTPTRDTHDLVTRVYPRGAGNGTAALDLSQTTRTAPAGYTFGSDAIGYYISNDAAEALYGRIDHHEPFKDIAVLDTDTNTPDPEPADITAASNQLFDAAIAWLATHCVELWSYALEITKLDVALEVGSTIEVQFRQTIDAYRAVDIDTRRDGRPLVILEATTDIDSGGVRTSALQVATGPRWPDSDIEYINQALTAARSMDAHAQPAASSLYATTAGHASSATSATHADTADTATTATPTAHASTHATAGSDPVTPAAIGAAPASAPYITLTPDAGLSGEFALSGLATGYLKNTTGTGVPTSQAVPIPPADGGTGTANAGTLAWPGGGGTAVITTDSRLSDARTPTAHATTHVGGGSDAIAVATGSVAGLESAADKTKLDALVLNVVDTADIGYFFGVSVTAPQAHLSAPALVGSANQVRAIQFVLPFRAVISQVTIDVFTNGAAGALVDVGLYDSAKNRLCHVAAGIAATGTGIKNAALDSVTTLPPGVYWLAATSNDTAVVVYLATISSRAPGLMNIQTNDKIGNAANAATAGILPTSLGAITGSTLAGAILACFER